VGELGDPPIDVQPPADGDGQGDGGQGQYAGYLKDVPEQFHGQLLDGFKKTDSYWQDKLNTAQSRFTPYEALVERYEPPYLQAAAAMMDELQSNPQAVLPWLAGELGVNFPQAGQPTQAQGGQQGWGQDQDTTSDWTQNMPPEIVERLQRLEQLEQLAELTGRTVLEQQQQAQMNEELAAFDQLLSELGTRYGKFDENWVLAQIEGGKSPEDAVKAYHDWLQTERAQLAAGRAPHIFGAGGGLPSNRTDVTKLDTQQTVDLVTQMVQAANSEG